MNDSLSPFYRRLAAQADGLFEDERHPVSNAANLAALLYHELDRVNWVGFYFLEGEVLKVGPFQGLPACTTIPLGRGVCGTAAKRRAVLRVDDVHRFDGHIVCDTASNSELVVPLLRDGEVIGVLDLDSPDFGRFTPEDEAGIAHIAARYLASVD